MPFSPVVTAAGVSGPLFQPVPELCAVPEVEPLASRVGSGSAAYSSFGAGVSPQCVSPAPLKEAEPSCLWQPKKELSHFRSFSRALSRGRACFARGTVGDAPPTVPCFLDFLSGPRFPLARAFSWAGWRVVTPIVLLVDKDFDINSAAVRTAIFHVLPQVHLLSCAVACNTKSRACEISRPGMSLPKPLRSAQYPRGLPDLQPKDAARVAQDNEASDFQLALQQALHEVGRGAFRENPRRSWHWQDPVEASLPGWTDFDYDACCFQGARRKSQKFRHNLPELAMLPSPVCGHTHSPNEWQPTIVDGDTVFHSQDEAEYTASLVFTIVVCASHWATQRGFAVPKLHRLPPMETTGDHAHWLQFSASALREDAMLPTAVFVGLTGQSIGSPQTPTRVLISDVAIVERGQPTQLPADVVYVGHGHFSHRLASGRWATPFKIGQHGSTFEISQLSGKRLACDCPLNQPWHADALVLFHLGHQAGCKGSQKPKQRARRVALATRAALLSSGIRVVRGVPVEIGQASLVGAASSLLGCAGADLPWPFLEDEANSTTFLGFKTWLADHHFPADGPLGPQVFGMSCAAAFQAGMANQRGAAGHKALLPPVVTFGLSPDAHFQASLATATSSCPHLFKPPDELDVHYAAHVMLHEKDLTRWRQARMEDLRALSWRLQPVSQAIRQQQHHEVRRVNPAAHFALLAVLVVLLAWPDVTFVSGLIHGFPAVGFAPPCGVRAAQPTPWCTLQDCLASGVAEAPALLGQVRAGEYDDFIYEAGLKDELQGWCTPARPASFLPPVGYRLVRRFCIMQSSGKKRVIDDAKGGGQSEGSSDASKLQFCTALQPCAHIQALAAACICPKDRSWLRAQQVVTFGEDLPDAYRKIPMLPEHTWACLMVYAHEGQAWWRRYHSMLFGLPLAVSAFNRLSFLLQAAVRRCLAILCSFYFDDATAQDFDFCACDSQSMLEEYVSLLGYAFAEAKRQAPSSQGDFLGIVHDLQDSLLHGRIPLWIRPRLIDKIWDLMDTAETYNSLPPGLASISSTRALLARSLASGSEPSRDDSTPQNVPISWMRLCGSLLSQSASS